MRASFRALFALYACLWISACICSVVTEEISSDSESGKALPETEDGSESAPLSTDVENEDGHEQDLRLVPIDMEGAPRKPTLRYLSAPLSDGRTSILIPLPTDLDERTGVVFVEDIREGDLSQRTFRTHIFRPSRSSPISFQVSPTRTGRVRGARHSTHVNTISNVNNLLDLAPPPLPLSFKPDSATQRPTRTRQAKTTPVPLVTTEAPTSEEEDFVTITTIPSQRFRSQRRVPTTRRQAVSTTAARSTSRETTTTEAPTTFAPQTTPQSESSSENASTSAEIVTTASVESSEASTTIESLRRKAVTPIVSQPPPGPATSTTPRRSSTLARSTRNRERTRFRSAVTLPSTTTVEVSDTMPPETTSAAPTPSDFSDMSSTNVPSSSETTLSAEQSSAEGNSTRHVAEVRVFTEKEYPTYAEVPPTNFDCRGVQFPGFYADMDTGCQVYHSCSRGRRHSFLCPNGTIFSQEYLICDWWYNVQCSESSSHFLLNKEAFSAPPKKKVEKKENALQS